MQSLTPHEEEWEDESEGEANHKEERSEHGKVILCGECVHCDANYHSGCADCSCSYYFWLILSSNKADHSREADCKNSYQNVVMRDNSAKAAADDEDGCKKISYNCSTHYSHTCLAILVNEIIKEVTSQYDEYCGHSELQTQNRVDFLDEADSDIAVTELI